MKVADFPSDNSPAEKAGLEVGDIIVSIDGKKVERVGQLQQEVGFKAPGDVVTVEVARKGGVRKDLQGQAPVAQRRTGARRCRRAADDDNDDAAPGNTSKEDALNAVVPQRLGIKRRAARPGRREGACGCRSTRRAWW